MGERARRDARGRRRERPDHGALERRTKVVIAILRAGDSIEDFLRRLHPEIRLEQDPLGLAPLARAAPEHPRQALPQGPPHQGRPSRRRHAHSATNAAITTTQSHHRSRRATCATPCPPPAPCSHSQSTSPARKARYASTLAPPRKAQR